ncbi:MAG TPA: Ig-like domain-containing protein, partial [Pyrinomonadaceae bacterium]
MKHSTRSTEFRSSRAILASLISFLIFFTPLTPLAVASPPSAKNRTPNVVSTETNAATSDAQTATHDNHAAVVSLANPAEPAAFLPSITATKVDSFPDTDGDGKAVPGEEITYTVTITNNGTTAATGVTFNDNFDSNTTFVPGSLQTQPIAFNDVASTFGNVRISTANGAINLIANDRDPDVGNGASSGLTASGPTTSANGGNVSISANGDFSYNPAPGFNGNDTFTYTVTDATGKTDTATVQITVGPTLIWFIDNTAAAGGDGRLTSPFNSITAYNASAPTKDPNDIIFIYQGSGAYTGNLTLTSGMKLIGQGFALQTETGAPPAGSDSLPGATANPTINSTSGNTVTLNQNNTIRGLTLNDAVGNDIIGNNFGTLTVSNVTISGTGRPLSLTTGTLAATFDQIISSNSSGGQGILLSAVGGSMAVTAGTSISGATTQGILVTGSTVSANFGNTSISGGTDGVSLQNNSSGTRTFGTLTVSGNTAVGFLHGAGGGTTNVTGATNITNPGGNGIDIQNSNAAISFAATTVGKNNAGTAVNLANNGTNTTSFSSLAITASNGAGLVTSAGGSLTVSTGSVTTTGTGVGVSLTNTTLNLTFTSISVTNGANGIVISGGSGSFTSGTTNLQSNAGADLTMSSSAVVANFGNTTSNSSAGAGVSLTSNTGNITFADLDITPDANNAGFVANSNTGTLTVTSGDITTSNAAAARAVTIDGPAGRTPINLTFTSITTTGVTESIHLVNVSGTKFQVTGTTQINTRAGTGILVNNSTATNIQFGTTNIPNVNNAGGYGIRVESSSSAVTVATATINNANITSGQTDAGTDFIPDNDGDGDAIFLKLNTGSFTLNGGTLSNCGNDCIDVRNSSALVLSGVTINTPGIDVAGGSGAGTGGHGIQAIGITGTNSITGGTITNFDTAARDGLRLIYTGATTATMTVQGTTFSDSTGGNGVLVLGRDTSNTTTTIGGPTNNVATNCTFSNLTAAGVLHGAGDNTGSTATTNLTIRNSTFTNPVALVDASNTISAHHANGGKATIQIIGNTLNNVARAASAQEGVISVSGDGTAAGNSLSLTIDNNTVSNIGGVAPNQCGAGAAPCLSYRGIQVFIDDQTNVSGTIYIRNNVLTNITRRGIYIDVANNTSPNNVNLVVSGNTIGTDAAPVGAIDATFQPGGEVGLSIEARRANPNAP